jgi:hypothetical protein
MRMRYAIAIAAAVALLTQQGAAVAQPRQDLGSANRIMLGCRSYVNDEDHNYYLQGICAGRVATIFYFGPAHFGVCPPDGANIRQAVRVVTLYIDQRPARMHERFDDLEVEALQQAWPCRR